MLLYGHNLNTVVSVFGYTRKNFFAEFGIAAYLLFVLRHSDVAFVNQQRRSVRLERFLFESIRILGRPYLCAEYMSTFILNHIIGPCRNAFALSAFPIDVQLVQIAVMNSFFGEIDFPVSVFQLFQLISSLFFPVIECAYKINMCSVWRPFTGNPSLHCAMQSKIKIGRAHV